MTKTRASVLHTAANNQMPLLGEEEQVYSLSAHGLLRVQRLLMLLPSQADRSIAPVATVAPGCGKDHPGKRRLCSFVFKRVTHAADGVVTQNNL